LLAFAWQCGPTGRAGRRAGRVERADGRQGEYRATQL